MSVQDIAQFCGLSESDIANLASYTKTIMGLTPSSLAGMGITSTHLNQLVQIASLTGANQGQLSSLATKQSQFEQDYLRSFLGGAASATSSTSKAGTTSGSGSKAQSKQNTLAVKQTAQFKAKQSTGAAVATKKTAAKAVSLAGASKNPHSPGLTSSLTSVAAKLSNSGVTLSKPAGEKNSGPVR